MSLDSIKYLGSFHSVFRVPFVDEATRPWLVRRNDVGTEYWQSPLNVAPQEVWIETVPATPPGATTAMVEVVTIGLTEDTSSAPAANWKYQTHVLGGSPAGNPPITKVICPATYGDAYRPKLYRYVGAVRTEITVGDGSYWVYDVAGGIIYTFNTQLPATATVYEVDVYRYIGQTLDGFVASSGIISAVTDGTTSVANVNSLEFSGTEFTVSTPGAGRASIQLSGSVQQYSVRDKFTYATPPKTFTLSTPGSMTVTAQATMALVYVNGILYNNGEYTFTGVGTATVILTWIGAAPKYPLAVGDIIEVIY